MELIDNSFNSSINVSATIRVNSKTNLILKASVSQPNNAVVCLLNISSVLYELIHKTKTDIDGV